MSADFHLPYEYGRTFKSGSPQDPKQEREQCVRLYCEQAARLWQLQIRAPMSLGRYGEGGKGKDFIVAGASLNVEQMRALRDAVNAALKEYDL